MAGLGPPGARHPEPHHAQQTEHHHRPSDLGHRAPFARDFGTSRAALAGSLPQGHGGQTLAECWPQTPEVGRKGRFKDIQGLPNGQDFKWRAKGRRTKSRGKQTWAREPRRWRTVRSRRGQRGRDTSLLSERRLSDPCGLRLADKSSRGARPEGRWRHRLAGDFPAPQVTGGHVLVVPFPLPAPNLLQG